MPETELQAVHLARKGIYSFLGQVYLLMPGEKLYKLIDNIMPELRVVAESSDEKEMAESIDEINAFLEERADLKGEELAEFELEALRKYTSLLCLGDSVPNVESYYVSGSKMYMQAAYDEMRELLRKYKLSISENVNECDDHIYVELMFMAKLASLSEEALLANNTEEHEVLLREQLDMHLNHFDRWIHLFAKRIFTDELSKGERLYNAFTKFLLGFLKEDKAILQELLGLA